MLSFRWGGKSQNGDNPHSHVGNENPIHIQGAGLRWDLNRGPAEMKGRYKETTEPD